MKQETINAIMASVSDRKIDLEAYAVLSGRKDYIERCSRGSDRVIDISTVKDDSIAEALAGTAIDMIFQSEHTADYSYRVLTYGMNCFLLYNQELIDRGYKACSEAVCADQAKCPDNTRARVFLRVFKNHLTDVEFGGDMCARDVWDLTDMHLSPDRFNAASGKQTICFSAFTNPGTKQCVKQYVKHLLTETHLAVSTICSEISSIRPVLNQIDKNIVDFDENDAESAMQALSQKYKNHATYVARLMSLYYFAQFLVEEDLIQKNVFEEYAINRIRYAYSFRETDRNMYIITQIFNVLDNIQREDAVLWFLLIYTTGMRKSEASIMKTDCLEKTEKGICYIHFYSTKMKKDVVNRIPESLYEMMTEYISRLHSESGYLFPSKINRDKPLTASCFSEYLQDEFIRLGVKNTDGTPYVFKPHDLRHWMAKRMYDEGIPSQFIQEQLHHASPEMTMAYIEFMNRRKAAKMKEFINNNGEKAPISADTQIVDDRAYAVYMQKHMSVSILPNGICARPKKLGKCPNLNSCLTCPDFRTSVEDLPKHKAYLERLEEFIASCDKNGWEQQAADSREIQAHLIKIIRTLETMKEAEHE